MGKATHPKKRERIDPVVSPRSIFASIMPAARRARREYVDTLDPRAPKPGDNPDYDAFFCERARPRFDRRPDVPGLSREARQVEIPSSGYTKGETIRRVAMIRAHLNKAFLPERNCSVALHEPEPIPEQLPPAQPLTPDAIALRIAQRAKEEKRRAKAEAKWQKEQRKLKREKKRAKSAR